MIPKHPFTPQTSQIPYKFGFNKDKIKAGEKVDITITGTFKGLLLEVREGDNAVGEWVVADTDPDFRTLNCHGNNNTALTHKNAHYKSNVNLTWKAPNKVGKYILYATIGTTVESFWAHEAIKLINVV
ncbi:unnamed protein product [Diabrotica balteata]|uniref:Reelin domain-containing protein n=1 Tax=Diabrotica balteata TaxID=107213 RepID=A0A9N9SNK6_DIABA|nr:unnamed protein product [Diabrotica balteata]